MSYNDHSLGSKEKVAPLDQLFSSLIPLLTKAQDQLKWYLILAFNRRTDKPLRYFFRPLPASHFSQLPKSTTVVKVTPLGNLAASPSIAAILALDPSQRTPLVSDYLSPLRTLNVTNVNWSPTDSKVCPQTTFTRKKKKIW